MYTFLLLQATERAALASYAWIGRGEKNAADQAAVSTLRKTLNELPVKSTVATGEGELDSAPLLLRGEQLGPIESNLSWDLAVDPIDGTHALAQGQPGAIVALAQAPSGNLFSAQDGYMEKLVVSKAAKGSISLTRPLLDNLKSISSKLGKPFSNLSGILLDKPRHQRLIRELQTLGLKIYTVPDGDILATIQVLLPNSSIDFLYGIGGAPEGVIAAVAVQALGGDMQARLCPTPILPVEAFIMSAIDTNFSAATHSSSSHMLTLDQLVGSARDIQCIVTAITPNSILKGITPLEYGYQVESLLINGNLETVRTVRTLYPQSLLGHGTMT